MENEEDKEIEERKKELIDQNEDRLEFYKQYYNKVFFHLHCVYLEKKDMMNKPLKEALVYYSKLTDFIEKLLLKKKD